jgi:hypothetical protein
MIYHETAKNGRQPSKPDIVIAGVAKQGWEIVEARPSHRRLLLVHGSSGRIGARLWRSGDAGWADPVGGGGGDDRAVGARRSAVPGDRPVADAMDADRGGELACAADRGAGLHPRAGDDADPGHWRDGFVGAAARRAGGAGDPGAAGDRGGHGGDPCAAYLDDRALGEGAALNGHWG